MIAGADEKRFLAFVGFGFEVAVFIMWKCRLALNGRTVRRICLRKEDAVKVDIDKIDKISKTLSEVMTNGQVKLTYRKIHNALVTNKLKHVVAYKNILDEFSVGHCGIKVKVT